jgi:hypothetical protein
MGRFKGEDGQGREETVETGMEETRDKEGRW